MNDFDSRIKSHRPIDWNEIDCHYAHLFEDAIVSFLQKLGYGENQEFKFDDLKKKKSRLSFRTQHVLSIKYSHIPSGSDEVSPLHHDYEFLIRYQTDDPVFTENIMVIPPVWPGVHFWSDLYNYLRIESKAIGKSNQRKSC